MKKRQFYYYSNLTPFGALGFALLALGVFFLTLPILIAALVIFGSVGAYLAWKINKTIKKAEEEMLKHQNEIYREGCSHSSHMIIDITPEPEEDQSLDDGRH